MSNLTVSDVRQIAHIARSKGRVPDLSGANLRGVDLSGVNL